MALSLKRTGFADKVLGVDNNPQHIEKAYALGLIDEKVSLEEGLERADLIIVAVPMNAIRQLLPEILDNVKGDQVVIDVGSTKSFLKEIDAHPNRNRLVATHPMAGTEYSGPDAAVDHLFDHKCAVICDEEKVMQMRWHGLKRCMKSCVWRLCILIVRLMMCMPLIFRIFHTSALLRWPLPYWKRKKKRNASLNWPVGDLNPRYAWQRVRPIPGPLFLCKTGIMCWMCCMR